MQNWTDNRRDDGLIVMGSIDGWVIIPADERPPLAHCPCCGKTFPDSGRARLVADQVYPAASGAP